MSARVKGRAAKYRRPWVTEEVIPIITIGSRHAFFVAPRVATQQVHRAKWDSLRVRAAIIRRKCIAEITAGGCLALEFFWKRESPDVPPLPIFLFLSSALLSVFNAPSMIYLHVHEKIENAYGLFKTLMTICLRSLHTYYRIYSQTRLNTLQTDG